MDSTSSAAGAPDVTGVYEALIARRAMSQQRMEGEAALRLIQAAMSNGQAQQVLPPDATISIRV